MKFIALGAASSALAALASPAAASDVQINFVDGKQMPVAGLDVFVHRADGASLVTELNAAASVTAQDAGSFITVELPTLGSSIDVQLTGSADAQVTLQVSRVKGLTGVVSVKPDSNSALLPTSGAVGPPANDDCVNAIPIGDGDTAFSNIGATTDGTVGSNQNDIWYTYTASCTGVATFSTCNQADFDTDLLVLTSDSTCAAQTALAINDDNVGAGCLGNTSLMVAPVTAGETYLLSVGGFGAASFGSGTISISCAAGAANDNCDTAEAVTVGSTVTFDNTSNTTAPTDPDFSCRFGSPAQGFGTTWFSFVATSESVLLDTLQSTGSTDTLIGVYEGGCDGLVEIACGEDADFDNLIFLTTVAAKGLTVGETYLVQVASYAASSQGSITLEIVDGPPVTSYNGTGVNTDTLTADCPALIGTDFPFEVTPGTGATTVFVSLDPALIPLAPFGEILINPSVILTLNSADGSHVAPVPDNPALVGAVLNAQGLVFSTLTLTNGIEFEIGSF